MRAPEMPFHFLPTFFLFLSLLLPISQSQDNITISFPSFNDTDRPSFALLKDSDISQGALQLTPDSRNIDSFLVNKSGSVLLNHPVKIWDWATPPPNSNSNSNSTTSSTLPTKHVASFHTSFTMNVYSGPNQTAGEGLAFLIASSLGGPPPGSEGGFLGLTNVTLDGNPSNHFVAIEFDTKKEYYDPDSNHVGLNINSVISNTTTSLTPLGIEIAPVNSTFHTVFIDYDGAARRVKVYMTLRGQPKPGPAILDAKLDLGDHLLQKSYFGFAASTGSDFELNCVLAWNLTVERLPDDGGSGWKWGLGIGLPSALVLVVLGFLGGLYVRRRKGGDPSLLLVGKLKSLPGTPMEFQFKDLKKATNGFDEKMKLGKGGFGEVYKGVLPAGNKEVAVKKFTRDSTKGQEDFLCELTIINRLRHRNLVSLLGWCHKNGVLLLVYDYMSNNSLDQHLYRSGDSDGDGGPILTWAQRYNILAGTASALHYLHNEYNEKVVVVHRDIKSSNIMLDATFDARLGDFGLARALDTDKTSFTDLDVAGTAGYVAPECFHIRKFTRESDVFAFGAVVLEVVTGCRPLCQIPGFPLLADWVWKHHSEDRILEVVDKRLRAEYEPEKARRLLLLGLACCHPIPGDRPKAGAIAGIISGTAEPPAVPPSKPPFMWPPAELIDIEALSLATSSSATPSYEECSADPAGSDT